MTDVTHGQLSAREQQLTKRGLRLAQFTVAYNVAEGVIAVTAGIMAGLVSLIGFGFDSGIESIAAVLVGLRLAARLRSGEADEVRERRALKLVAMTFFLLAAYVIIEGIRNLRRRHRHPGGVNRDHAAVGTRQAKGRRGAKQRPAHSRRCGRDADLRLAQRLDVSRSSAVHSDWRCVD